MFLQQIFKAITSGWKWIVAFVLIAICVSLLISTTTVPIYQASATFVIAPNKDLPSSRDVVSAFTALDTLDIFSTYADILSSVRVISEANKVIGLSDEELAGYGISTQMNPDSIILRLSVEGPDPNTAAYLANEMGKYGIQFINAYFSVFEIDFLDQAVAPATPYKPRTYHDMAVAAGVGLLLGLVVVITKELIEIPLNQFIQRFSLDNESLALSKVSILRALGNMRSQENEWPITFMLVKLVNFMEVYEVLPKFSRKVIATKIVKRLKHQVKGADLIGRWDDSVFAIVLPRTPAKVSSIIIEKIKKELADPILYGVDNSEQLILEPVFSSSTGVSADDFETLVSKAESDIRIRK
jgi:capsular polysaccharide biosynthesis protein/GGDEF domain-containing protein